MSSQINSAHHVLESDRLDPEIWKVVAVVFLGPLMAQLDSTVVNVSLASIRDVLHSSLESAQWIISGYLLALALTLPLNAWLVDRIGAKRLYIACFTGFTLASLLCGAARSMDELIWARVIQGMTGGLLAPMAQMMLARVAGKHMARVIGYTAVPVLLAPLLGPVVAGVILKYAGWPWLFYINLPIGILAVLLAILLLPPDRSVGHKRRFDFLGFILISPGLAFSLYGFEHASENQGLLFLSLGLLLIGGFVWDSLRRGPRALMDLSLFKIRIFSIAISTQFLANAVVYAGQVLVPLYLINGCGFTPTHVGWLLAPMGLGMLCVYPLMGALTDRFGCRAVSVSGVLINTVGTLPFLWMVETQFSQPLMLICMFVRGVGQGAVGVPSLSAAYASVPKEKLPMATTAANIVQRLGGPIGTTALAIVMSSAAKNFPATGALVYRWPFVALMVLQLLVLSVASRLPVWIHQKK